jgi:hypothetical protein
MIPQATSTMRGERSTMDSSGATMDSSRSTLVDALKLSALDDYQQRPPEPRYLIGAALGDPLSGNRRGILAMPVDHHPGQQVEVSSMSPSSVKNLT